MSSRTSPPANPDLQAIKPEISRFPLPMSSRRARFEAQRARLCGLRLPAGHPYALMPRWVPYPLARLVGTLHRIVGPR